jgi:hypothetical protein
MSRPPLLAGETTGNDRKLAGTRFGGWVCAGDGPRRRAAAVPAAAGRLARESEARGNAQGFELLWDLGEALGRSSDRRVEWKGSSSGRRAWQLGGLVEVAGADACAKRLKALNRRASACQAQRLSLQARAGAGA